jgi:hypothetical protein
LRLLVALSLGLAAAIVALAVFAASTGSTIAAALLAPVVGGLVGILVHRHPVIRLEATGMTRGWKLLFSFTTLAALVQLTRLAIFIIDPARSEFSLVPSSDWEIKHSCVSAYYVAAQSVDSHPNVYDNSLYSMPDDDPATSPRKARMIGPFRVDVYEYPPPFLILPRALRLLLPDFQPFAIFWFALNTAVLLIGLLLTARFLGPRAGMRALLLAPFVLVAVPTLTTLQKGNFQVMVIAASMLSMILFERRCWAAGGAMLSFAILSKLYPGILIVYLLVRRRWRAVSWTAAFGMGFILLSFLDLGRATYAAFLEHLPGLLSGESFPAFRNPMAMAINGSIPGLAFKLKLFGVPGMNFEVARLLGWIYTVVVVALTVLAARRRRPDAEGPLVWLALLILATLRSPFLPQGYGFFPSVWLLVLLVATHEPNRKLLWMAAFAWLILNFMWPVDWPLDPRLLAVVHVIPATLAALVAWLGLQRRPVPEVLAVPTQNHARLRTAIAPGV